MGGVADLAFNQGDDIRFEVDSDTADEVHVHGYDIEEDVEAGGTVEFDFPADLEGRLRGRARTAPRRRSLS